MPVEQTSTGVSLILVSQLVYSRWLAIKLASLPKAFAKGSTRPGSPGSTATVAPCSCSAEKPTWYKISSGAA